MTAPPPTIPLLTECAVDAEALVVAWLSGLRRSGSARQAGDPLPFTLITHITGAEDADLGLAEPVVSVHTLAAKSLGWGNAKNEAQQTHLAMLELARYRDTITLANGTPAEIDYLSVFQAPIWVPYEDAQILRKVGRYTIGLSYIPIPPASW